MKKLLTALLFVFVASLVFAAIAPTPTALANTQDIKISLKGSSTFPNAKGSAKYRDRGGEREFQVEVENVKKLAGQQLGVFVDGKKIGAMLISSLGVGRLNLNSNRGNNVPNIKSGSKVQVKTGAGVLVVVGSF